MRKIAVWGAVLSCAVLIVSGVRAQTIPVPGDDGSATGAIPVPVTVANVPAMTVLDGVIDVRRIRRPVEVTGTVNVGNFPTTQNVAGAVTVTNLPAVQSVAGAVDVGNLPLDAQGNLRVAGSFVPAPQIHFVGFTSPAPLNPPRWLEGSRLCATEHPETRLCTVEEFYRSIPVPPPFPIQMQGTGWARMFARHPSTNEIAAPDVPFLACLRSDGELEGNTCLSINGLTETPFACCGF